MTMSISVFTKSRTAIVAGLGALTLTLGACANYGGTRSPGSVGYASTVKEGVIQSVSGVTIRPDNSIVGAGVGAVLGGIAGSELGGGDKAKTAGAIGGAVLGGIAGNEAGKALNTRNGYSYIVKFSTGELKEIVVKGNEPLPAGIPVNVVFATDGVQIYAAQAPQYAPAPRY